MRDMNMVALVGRLTRDSELKYTKSGVPVARFSLAVNRSVKHGDAWEDEASFFDIDLWGKQGEAVNRYLTKGQQVAIEGELRQERWTQDGQQRSKIVVAASNVRLIGGKHEGQGQPAATVPQAAPAPDAFSDDIPF